MTTNAIQGYDPRNGKPVGGPVPATTRADLDSLLAAATDAAAGFARSGPSVRAGLLRAIADRLDERASQLVPLAEAESGLPTARLTGEVARTSGQLRMFATVVEDGGYLQVIHDSADPQAGRPELHRWLEPVGPVEVFAASNFPFAFSVLGGDTASALATGCPVVVKAHPSHPGLSRAVRDLTAEAVAGARLPAGVFTVVFGDDTGVAALRDHRIRAAGFTGSTVGGRFLFDVAASRPDPIPFFGELGSINPVVVTPDAVAARGPQIVDEFVTSMTLGTGQFCTKPGLLFVPRGHGLDAEIAAAVGNSPPAPMLNARIRSNLDSGLAALSAHPGVELIATATGSTPSEGSWASAAVYRTTAARLHTDVEAIGVECFGPNTVVVEYEDAEDVLSALVAVEGSLTATVHAQPGDSFPVRDLIQRLSALAGRVIFNGWPTGVAVAWAMNHGGPWPAATFAGYTSVGATAVARWLRPVCYQSMPNELLPEGLRSANPWRLPHRADGRLVLPS